MALKLVAVIGGASCSEEEALIAEELGRRIAQAGYGLVCGGGSGVMEAACKGAFAEGGLTIGLLSGENPRDGNGYLRIVIPTGMGEMRNALVVRAAQAVIAVGGEYGTLSELALALKAGKPVFGINTWKLSRGGEPDGGIQIVGSAEAALTEVKKLLSTDEAVEIPM